MATMSLTRRCRLPTCAAPSPSHPTRAGSRHRRTDTVAGVTPLAAFWLGRAAYTPTLERMQRIAARRADGSAPDTLLLLEHDQVYTLGRRGSEADILLEAALLESRGVEVAHTDRGGLVTYHGPGQLVAYPILDLGPNASAATYVAQLERAVIAFLAGFGIEAMTIEGLRGVWVGDRKVAAIGVHLAGGVSTHGVAINLDPDLSMFAGIVPCGISDRGVTSVREATGARIPLTLAAKRFARTLAAELDRELTWPHPTTLEPEHAHG